MAAVDSVEFSFSEGSAASIVGGGKSSWRGSGGRSSGRGGRLHPSAAGSKTNTNWVKTSEPWI